MYLTPTVRYTGTEQERDVLDLFVDVKALLEGGLPEPVAPALCKRSDGHALFYRGQVNCIFGLPESGKTWLCLAAAAEALSAGLRVLVLDMDHSGPTSTVERLLALGAPVAALTDKDLFRYVEPDDSLELTAIVAVACTWSPAVAVVDSIGELLPLLGLSSNSPDDFTVCHARVLKPLAKAGAAVLAVDHLAKNAESRASGPTGTAAKRRAIGGSSIRVVAKDQFTPGSGGAAVLTVNKDRHGGLRRHCPQTTGEVYAGLFVLDHIADGDVIWRIAAPHEGERAPLLDVSPGDVTALAELSPAPTSVRDVKERLGWGTDRCAAALRAWRTGVPDTGVQVQRYTEPVLEVVIP